MKFFFVFISLVVCTRALNKISISHLIQDPRKNSTYYDLVLRERVSYGSIIANIRDVLLKKNLVNRNTKILEFKLIYYSPQLLPSSLLSTTKKPEHVTNFNMEPIFSVDSLNGSIYIKTPNEPILEYLCLKKQYCACISCIFSLNIIYRTDNKISAETIRLFIDDTNDYAPEFHSKSDFILNVSEASKIGDLFTLPNSLASDSDAFYNEISYFVSDSKSDRLSNIFEVNRVDKQVELVLKTHLDFELKPKYELYLFAKDNGQPSLSTWRRLLINVIDENDNQPICEKSLFIENVKENAIKRNVLQIKASDLDSGLNSQLEYSLESHTDLFEVDSNGWIHLKSPLDFELKQSYDLRIKVTDSGIVKNYTTVCFARLNVLDVNDNRAKLKMVKYLNESVQRGFYSVNSLPDEMETENDIEFSLTNKNVKNQIEFYENNENNLTLGLIRVFDRDLINNYKFLIQSATSSHDDTSMFEIRQSDKSSREYELVAIGTFNSEIIQNYRLKIVLYDLNEGEDLNNDSFRTTLFQRVKVLDLNDNRPEFLSKFYEFSIKENDSNETLVSNNPIEVYDLDISEQNSFLKFDLKSKSNITISDYIKINDTLNSYPSLCLIKPFDYEQQGDLVEFQLVAYDTDGFNDTTLIALRIENVNDNPPIFLNENSTFKIKENLQIDTVIGQLLVSDLDIKGQNPDMTFNIVNEPYTSLFKIYKTGIMSNLVVLDREIQNFYSLKIEVFDNGSPNLSSIGTFYIQIEDENDNKPLVIYPNEKTKHLNIKLGPYFEEIVQVFDVKALDYDFEENARLTYQLTDSLGILKIDSQYGNVTFNATELNITSQNELTAFKTVIDVCLNVSDNGTPSLWTLTNFTLYLNYEFFELTSEVQKLIQNEQKINDYEDKYDLKNSNLYKFGSGKYRNFFQIVSNSVLLIILLSVLFFMIFVACFIIAIMFKKAKSKHQMSQSKSFINCFVQVKDVFKDTVNWSRVSSSKTEENLTVKDEITGPITEPITVDNFRIVAKTSEPLMHASNNEILNSESINDGTSEEFSNELNVYSQEFASYDYSHNKKYQNKLVVSDEVKVVHRSNNSYLTSSNNNTPSSTNSLMKNVVVCEDKQEIYQNEFYNFNNQNYFKQSFKCKITPLNNLSDSLNKSIFGSQAISQDQMSGFIEKFEKYYHSPDYSIESNVYKNSTN